MVNELERLLSEDTDIYRDLRGRYRSNVYQGNETGGMERTYDYFTHLS